MRATFFVRLSVVVLLLVVAAIWLNRQKSTRLSSDSRSSAPLSEQTTSIKRSHAFRPSVSRGATELDSSHSATMLLRIDRLKVLLLADPSEENLQKITELIESANPDELRSFATVFETAPAGSALQHALTHYMRKWGETDPHAALDYAYKSQAGSDLRIDSAQEAVALFAAKDLNGALSYIHEIQTPERQKAFVNQLAPLAVRSDPIETRRWILNLAEDEQKQSATFAALQQLSDVNSIKAADWALSMMNEGFMKDAAVSVCSMVAASDPARALAFVDYIAPGPAKDQTLQMIYSRWYLYNPEAATHFYAGLQPGPEKDLMTKAFYEMRTMTETANSAQ